jgi:transposase
MGRHKLTDQQVQQQLQEGRNYHHLYFELKAKYDTVVLENKELRALVAAQATTIAALQTEVTELRAEIQRLKDSGTKYKFYLFKDQKKDTEGGGRRPPLRAAASYVRPRPSEAEITDHQELRLETCPHCQGAVSSSVESFTTVVEDIVFTPKSVTEYTVHRHWCAHCHQLVRAALPNALPGMSLGLNTILYVLVEHYRAKKTDEQIVESLQTYFGLHVSSGEVTAIRDTAARYFAERYNQIVRAIRQAAVLYADETGWYIQGQRHGQCWHLQAPEVPAMLFHLASSRAKDELQSLLGSNFQGVIVSDFYAVYDGVGSDQQKCWVHLLRDSHLALQASPDDEERRHLHRELTELYGKITRFRAKAHWRQWQAHWLGRQLDKQLQTLSQTDWQDSQCRRLAKRLRKYHHQLLACLRYPSVLPENNTAERGLRPVVVQRKITNGSRSSKGAHTYEVNMSVMETLRAQVRAQGGELLTQLGDTLWQRAWAEKFGVVASLG